MSGAAVLSGLSALKLALMAKEARQRTGALLRADPIAIVGMACRVPGADSPEQLWSLLCDGRDAVREIPADRWDAAAWADADLAAPGKIVTRRAACLERIDGFDAEYFGILPREAERMDPQQRLFMEVAMEALDDAGLTRAELASSRTGVYVASYHNDYTHQQYADVATIDARTLTGTLHSVLANRLSYFLDLRGPSLSVDTACSSSLVAIHLACQGLRSGESDLALAGGVSLIVAPELMVAMSKVGFMSPDGRCKTFDALADGFGRGEGCGLLVLKRLSDAVAQGDRVLAVIRGSAVNQDGHSTLLAAPHGPAQEALMREALSNAGLDAGRIGFIETHGTGTALGDPIEVEAIANVVGRDASAGPCFLGSVKANVGHLEAAAGVTGAIKAVLALRHGCIPPQPNFRALNPHITLDGTRLRVAAGLEPWGANAAPRCASVSSFGVGGTNAHVILEEAPRLPAEPSDEQGWQLLALSAHNPAALADVARRWAIFLSQTSTPLSDICFTANCRRTHLDARLALVGRSRADLAARLEAFASSDAATGVAVGRCLPHRPAKLAFVFSGQGPQWFAMGRELLDGEPTFRAAIERCDALLRPLAGWSLLDELGRDESQSRLARTEFAQPALFALQVALAEYWQSLGVVPDAVVGHSLGEIAALCVAGVLDLPTAVRLVWLRGRIMDRVTGQGRMASVGLSEEEALARLQPFGERLSLAAVNAPRGVVLSGETAALESLLLELAREGIAQRLLPVDYAFHSAQMTPLRAELVAELGRITVHPARVAVYSTVLGRRMEDGAIDAEYFGRNLREPVRFSAAVSALADDGINAFLEIAPHPVLASAIAEGLATRETPPVVAASLRRARSERESILQAAAALHACGVALRWDAIVAAPGNVVQLPAYPWQHRRFWIRPRSSAPSAPRTGPALLGDPLQLADGGLTVRSGDASAAPWLADHRIGGRLLLPAAAMMEAMLAAADAHDGTAVELLDFAIQRPVVLNEGPAPEGEWQLHARVSSTADQDLVWYARGVAQDGAPAWQQAATARARAEAPRRDADGAAPAMQGDAVDADAFYARMLTLGVDFGPAFRRLERIEHAPGRAVATLSASEHDSGLRLHPTLIDAAMQLCSIAAAPEGEVTKVWLPLGADRIWFDPQAGLPRAAEASVRRDGGMGLCVDTTLRDADGRVVLRIERLRFAAASSRDMQGGVASTSPLPLYAIEWSVVDDESRADRAHDASGPWLLLADDTGVAARLGEALAQRGAVVTEATAAQVGDCAVGAEMLTAVVRRVAATVPQGALHVVHCWALDAPRGDARPEGASALLPASLLHLVQACAAAGTRPVELTIVTRGAQCVSGDEDAASLSPHAAAAWGLAGTIALEHPDLQLRIVDLDPRPHADDADAVSFLLAARQTDEPVRHALRRGQRWQPRLVRAEAPVGARAVDGLAPGERLEVVRAGTLDGVAIRDVASRPLAAHEVRLRVVAAGLNFRDVLLVLGMYPGGAPLGAECAGEVLEVGVAVRTLKVGDRVFGLAPGALAGEVIVPAAFVARLPAGLGFDAAAGLPVAFLTAHHGLFALAGLQPNQRVLVHAGAGGVGMAAIQLALRRGATVYATAGTAAKRALLLRSGVTAAFDSRSTTFADELLAATGGEGVDVVLNSLAGEFIPASLRVLVRGGTFLELGKRDDWTAEAAAAAYTGVRHCRYDFATEAARRPEALAPMYDDLLAGLADGSLQALPTTNFPVADAQDAMRHMAQALHVGKIVLRVSRPTPPSTAAVRADGTYWITGGLGAIGLATARWLAAQGAGHLVLSARRAPDAEGRAAIASLEQAGSRVSVLPLDVGDDEQVRGAVAMIRRDALPLRGIFHAAGSLHDGVLATQRWDDARAVFGGKVDGAWNLHAATTGLDLDCFVLYSAAGVWLGAPGQGLYSAANAALDALARHRRRLGLPALSVAWGLWSDGGMAARAGGAGRDAWAGRGLLPLDAATGMACLGSLLGSDAAHALVLPMDWARFLAQVPEGADRSVFAALAPAATPPAAVTPAPRRSIVDELRALVPAQRRTRLADYLAQQALAVLGLDAATALDPRAALKDAGLDSLMAVELRNLLTRVSPEPLPATLLFDYPTLVALTDCLMKLWQLDGGAAAPRSPAAERAPEPRPVDIDAMSEAEAEAALLAELDRDKLAPAR